MARYIDADVLKKRLGEIGYEADDLYAMGINRGLDRAETAVDMIPTADVVPKSEYDEVLSNWQKIHDSYNSDCIEHYKYGRAEVAREIFEEIPKIFVNRILHNESQYFEGVLDNITKDLDELKKKYTEGEK